MRMIFYQLVVLTIFLIRCDAQTNDPDSTTALFDNSLTITMTAISCKFDKDREEDSCIIDTSSISNPDYTITKPTNASDVKKITMKNNIAIKYIPKGIGENFKELKKLFFSHNRIEKIDKAVLSNLSKLKIIFFDGNKISEIPEDSFDDLTSLEHLDLDENKVKSLTGRMLRNLRNLKELSIHDNEIKTLDEKVFATNLNLITIKLNNNKLVKIPSGLLEGLTNLNMVNLEGNPCIHEKFSKPSIHWSFPIAVSNKCGNGNSIENHSIIIIIGCCVVILLLAIALVIIYLKMKKEDVEVPVQLPDAFENQNYGLKRKNSGVRARYNDENMHESSVRRYTRNIRGVTSDSEHFYEEIELNMPKESCLKYSHENYRYPKNGN